MDVQPNEPRVARHAGAAGKQQDARTFATGGVSQQCAGGASSHHIFLATVPPIAPRGPVSRHRCLGAVHELPPVGRRRRRRLQHARRLTMDGRADVVCKGTCVCRCQPAAAADPEAYALVKTILHKIRVRHDLDEHAAAREQCGEDYAENQHN